MQCRDSDCEYSARCCSMVGAYEKYIYKMSMCVCVLCLSVYTWPVPTPACPPALLHKTLSLAAIHHAIRRLHNHTRRNYKNHIIFISTPLSDVVSWKKRRFEWDATKKELREAKAAFLLSPERRKVDRPLFIILRRFVSGGCSWSLLLQEANN